MEDVGFFFQSDGNEPEINAWLNIMFKGLFKGLQIVSPHFNMQIL